MPQPIDLQTELARIMAAERIQDASTRLSLAARQQAQDEAEVVRMAAESSVGETPESQSEELDEDGRRKNPFVGRRSRKGEEAEAEEARRRAASEDEGHHFDVSV